tara:strand:+ start:71 stop:352 length:282 start_codon:yes stop_codon:yes gene_type:complete
MAYASGKRSKAICDRCGQKYKYSQLREEVENSRRNGLRVCSSCLDVDHPQLKLGKTKIVDNQALKNPRPDKAETATVNTAFNNRFPHTAGVTS